MIDDNSPVAVGPAMEHVSGACLGARVQYSWLGSAGGWIGDLSRPAPPAVQARRRSGLALERQDGAIRTGAGDASIGHAELQSRLLCNPRFVSVVEGRRGIL